MKIRTWRLCASYNDLVVQRGWDVPPRARAYKETIPLCLPEKVAKNGLIANIALLCVKHTLLNGLIGIFQNGPDD